MVSRTVRACEELMMLAARAGFTNQIGRRSLTELITIKRGQDPRTIKNWLNTLNLLGYIEPMSVNVFKLDFSRCSEALGLLVKRGQKKLL